MRARSRRQACRRGSRSASSTRRAWSAWCSSPTRSPAETTGCGGALYAGGALLGALPALVFNWWALGSPFEFAYGSAVDEPGFSGHDTLGLNDEGFFGITAPKPASALDLLVANRGTLTLTPVIAAALAGLLIMWRRGERRPEVATIGAVALVYFYNSGYWLAFGGGSPGPRFLIPALPFIALGLATAYRRLPAIALALAIPSFVMMARPRSASRCSASRGRAKWADFIEDGHLKHTLLTALGVTNAWVAIAPVIAAAAARSPSRPRPPRTRMAGLGAAACCVAGWAAIAVVGPSLAGDENTPLGSDGDALPDRHRRRGLAAGARGARPAPPSPQPGPRCRASPRSAGPARRPGAALLDLHPEALDGPGQRHRLGEAAERSVCRTRCAPPARAAARPWPDRGGGHLVDQRLDRVGHGAGLPVDDRGNPIGGPQQVAPVVLRVQTGQVKLGVGRVGDPRRNGVHLGWAWSSRGRTAGRAPRRRRRARSASPAWP